jgi:drug/metabolite transporter (DMT)-like permease
MQDRASARRGIAFMVAAMVVFSAQDAISKQLAENHAVPFVAMIRYWAFAVFVLALSARRPGGLRAVARTAHPVLQWGRGALLALEIVVTVIAFHRLGLAAAHAVFASYALMVTALSGPLLGERVGWRRWTAVGVGFLGVLVIVRPGSAATGGEAWIAVLAAAMFALYHVATRHVSRADGSATSFFYTGLGGAVTMTLIGPFYAGPMVGWDAVMMAVLCVTGMTGHYLLIRALDAAEASTVQPFAYLQLVFASFIGVFLFGETIDATTVAGATLVVGAGLFTLLRERAKGVAPPPGPAR